MKIFITHENPYSSGNPYMYTLMDCICRSHPDVQFGWGTDVFWRDHILSYDIIHFHWSQVFMNSGIKKHTLEELRERLEFLKKRGIKIVSTCHDLQAHYSDCVKFSDALGIVYENSEVIFHLGIYSKKLFEEKYPSATHFLLPHHLYDTVYCNFPTKEDSIKKLGLKSGNIYILCFGAFRDDEERELVLDLVKRMHNRKVYILAPSFIDIRRKFKLGILPTISFLKMLYYRIRFHICCSGKSVVPISDDLLPYYYGVSDLVLIQRKKILNSGNAIMPLLFERIVVGPDVGNVGAFLNEYGFPTFNVNEPEFVYNAVISGLERKNSIISRNEALSRLSTEKISQMQYEYYKYVYNR